MAEIKSQEGNFFFYSYPNGKITLQVILGNETVWLSQKQLANLFGVESNTITYHLKEIYQSGELQQVGTARKIRVVQKEGGREVSRDIDFFNLDVIIAVGYRVNSYEATQFRVWATKILKEYLIKGFALDDNRLKQGKTLFGKDYFDELLERIREIRTSERRFYQKITDLYALSSDYDPNSPTTKTFFATCQNKLEFAITGQTAAEIIYSRADSKKPFMGLSTWKNAPTGKVVKSDSTVAKNYLNDREIDELNRIVEIYLNMAELQAKKRVLMKMSDWATELDNFLEFAKYEVLQNAGSVARAVADSFAEKEYEKFRVIQDIEYKSDFDKVLEGIKSGSKLPKEIESHQITSEFNNVLNAMMKVPPPKKE